MLPDLGDAGKVAGGGVAASLLTVLAGRIFGGQDKVLARLDALQLELTSASKQLAVMVAALERRDSDVERLQRQVEEQGKAIAKLEATLEQISEGFVR
jgi:peptidoglycan hydrolase CwlO-like protein